jgi:hypothetical protein
LDPLLTVAKKAEMEDALARLDEFKASDMDVAFATFGVKVVLQPSGAATGKHSRASHSRQRRRMS